ncbi:MAG: hypothetical protein HYZ00_00305 [Candidatus Hydrogenedentes bacterium]|nr:hypothetical protein [Candidatus Hydrogenedentota bacterium]
MADQDVSEGGAILPSDPRLQSGTPGAASLDAESFVRLSGQVRTRLHFPETSASAPPFFGETTPPGEAGATVAGASSPASPEIDQPPPWPEMLATQTASLERRRLETSSRLLEAEQLLQELERQPREAQRDAQPALATRAGHEAAPAPPPAEFAEFTPRRRSRAILALQVFTTLAAFLVAAWLMLNFLLRVIEPGRMLIDNLEDIPPAQLPVTETPSGQESPARPARVPMIEQDITLEEPLVQLPPPEAPISSPPLEP